MPPFGVRFRAVAEQNAHSPLCLKLICLIARFSTYETHLFVDSASVVSIFARNTFFVNEPFFPNTLEFLLEKTVQVKKIERNQVSLSIFHKKAPLRLHFL